MVTRSLGLLSTLVLARLLVPADFGLVAMATTFSAGVESLSQLGLQDALVRRRNDGMGLHHAAFTLQFARALLTAAIIAGGAPLASWWFDEPRLIPILLVLAAVTAIGGLENVGLAEYRRAMRFDVQFRMLLTRRLVSFVTTLVCALVFRSYVALLAGVVAGTLIWVPMSYWMHPFRPRFRLKGWRDLAHFSVWTWAAGLASLVWDRCDPFVLGPSLGTTRLGLYLIATEVATLPVTELIAPAADALFSGLARAQKDGTSSLPHALNASGIILLVVAPLVLTISAAAGPIVALLLGRQWGEAWPVVSTLSWLCLFAPFSWICSSALVANGHVRQNFWTRLVMSGTKLIALVITIRVTVDLVNIAMAMTACVTVESLLFAGFVAKIGKLRWRQLLWAPLRIIASLGLAVGALALLGLGWSPGEQAVSANFLQMLYIGSVATSIYAGVLFALWWVMDFTQGPERQLFDLCAAWMTSRKMRWGL